MFKRWFLTVWRYAWRQTRSWAREYVRTESAILGASVLLGTLNAQGSLWARAVAGAITGLAVVPIGALLLFLYHLSIAPSRVHARQQRMLRSRRERSLVYAREAERASTAATIDRADVHLLTEELALVRSDRDAARSELITIHSRERQRADVWIETRGDAIAVLCVTNRGPAATFYATFRVRGSARGLGGAEFVAWTHTSDTRIRIPRGVTCYAVLAQLLWHSDFADWVFTARTEEGLSEARAMYSSCPTSVPIVRAQPIWVHGHVIADPDLEEGPIPYEVQLSAFNVGPEPELDEGSPESDQTT